MPVDSKHPDYQANLARWQMMRSVEEGEERVKEEGVQWLPMPSGFTAQADGGAEFYRAYQTRAQFPDILQPTLEGMIGVIHRVEAKIDGLDEGKPLSYMWEKATRFDTLSLEAFHRRITAEILLMGRYSILTDVPSDGNGQPYLTGYTAEQLINWSQFERDLFVLDESRRIMGEDDEFSWADEKRYRVLRLSDGSYTQQVYVGADGTGDQLITPSARGNKALTEIPLVVVGPRELSVQNIERSPLLGVARSSMAIYRLDADYRWQLYNSGQETAVIIGETDNIPRVMGSGIIIGLPAQSDAKYIGPSGVGIDAHRQAIMDERQNAVANGVKLFDTAKAESGEALRLRASAQTATLTTIALSSAAALERALRYAATFVGQDPNEIIVKPNLAFVDTKMTAKEAADLVTVWQSGGMSWETLYENLQRGEIASSERTAEEEKDLIDQEIADQPQAAGGGDFGGGDFGGIGEDLSRFIESGSGLGVG